MRRVCSFCSTAVLLGGLTFETQPSEAAIPVGSFSSTVTNLASGIWDVSKVTQLQNLDAGVSKLNADIHFSVIFTQNGAGKLAGQGITSVIVNSADFSGTLPSATYKVVGTVSSKDGHARLNFVASASTLAMINGRDRVVKATAARVVMLDSATRTLTGTYRNSASASGLGSGTQVGAISYAWADVQSALGDGSWKLALILADAGNNKIGGTATVTLNSGSQWSFAVKGVYNPKTDTTKLVLIPTTESKGSSLKVEMTGASVTGIRGKISGQSVDVSLGQ